jgi:putative ABC transport system substrate-binding protein
MNRREFITLLSGAVAAWPLAARAQSPKMLRVGYSGMLPREAPHYAAFEKRMAELGYQEGRNFTFEYIQAPNIEGYELAYRELAARNVDILLAAGNEPALRAARAAAGTTPTVFIALDFDPVEKGYVASLSRPANNSTGLFVSQLELAGKRVEFLRKTFPKARRIGLSLGCDIAGASRGRRCGGRATGLRAAVAGSHRAAAELCGCPDADGSMARRADHDPCKPARVG